MSRDFMGEGVWHPSRKQQGEGTQEDCSATVSGFMLMGLVSGLFLANHSDSQSFLVVHSAKMDAREKDSGKWSHTWCLLLTFPELFQLVRLISSVFLTRTSCHKTTHANGY